MLNNTLNTNEVKNSSASEVEFQRISTAGRRTEYAQIIETPSLPHRLSVAHQETGSGIKGRRRSVVRVDKTVISTVDGITPVTVSAYIVLDAPVGALNASTEMTNTLAELGSFTFLTGSGTTLLFDGTGNGSQALLTGGL